MEQRVSAKLLSLFFEGEVGILIRRGAKKTARLVLDMAYGKGIKTAYHNGASLNNSYYYASNSDVIYVIKDKQLVVLNRPREAYKVGVDVSFPNKDDLHIKLLGVAVSDFDNTSQRVILFNSWAFRHHIPYLEELVKSTVRKEVLL